MRLKKKEKKLVTGIKDPHQTKLGYSFDLCKNLAFSVKDPEKAEVEEEEVIRCVCNIFRDEGLMIMCEKCQVWQHCDCMGVRGDEENYMCEQCDPRPVNLEVPQIPQPRNANPGCVHYMTLLHGDVQVRIGDCVYVQRDEAVGAKKSPTKKSGPVKKKLDIFRIVQLWKNEE